MAFALLGGGCSGEKLGATRSAPPPDASVGTVTFRLALPTTQTFCDQIGPCDDTPSHIMVGDNAGGLYDLTVPFFCQCSEATCITSCAYIACIGPGQGEAVTSGDQTWDGVYYGTSDHCGSSCVVPFYLRPGQYFAQVCARPGTLSPSDGGAPACTSTGSLVCGPNVTFTYPSTTPVLLTLPGPDGG